MVVNWQLASFCRNNDTDNDFENYDEHDHDDMYIVDWDFLLISCLYACLSNDFTLK